MPADRARLGTAQRRGRSRVRAAGGNANHDGSGDSRDAKPPSGYDAGSSAIASDARARRDAQDLIEDLSRSGCSEDHCASDHAEGPSGGNRREHFFNGIELER